MKGVWLAPRVLVHETPELYASDAMQAFIRAEIDRTQWVYRVIKGEQEASSVLFSDDNYMILPDCDAANDDRVLNWMVLFKDPALRSIRDLRGEHLGMLREVRERLKEMVPASYGGFMTYFHKPASVWQLHLHVAAPCGAIRTTYDRQKVLFLEDCISCLELDSDFFAKVTMTYMVSTRHVMAAVSRAAQ